MAGRGLQQFRTVLVLEKRRGPWGYSVGTGSETRGTVLANGSPA